MSGCLHPLDGLYLRHRDRRPRRQTWSPAPRLHRSRFRRTDSLSAAPVSRICPTCLQPPRRISFQTKVAIEEHIRTLPIKWTILRPVAFYENFLWDQFRLNVPTAWGPTTNYKMIGTEDIGRIVAEVLERPAQFTSKTLDIASDSVTRGQALEVWKEVTGRDMQDAEVPELYPMVANTVKVSEKSSPTPHLS